MSTLDDKINEHFAGFVVRKDLVKAVASDLEFKARYSLGAVNSINWARLVAQVRDQAATRLWHTLARTLKPQQAARLETLLIADEPTTALDVSIEAQILDIMREMQQSTNMAIMFITHNLGVVASMAHEIVVMYMGKAVERAKVQDLFYNPKHPYTQSLLKSIPQLGKKKNGERLASITGSVPNPFNLPTGCVFHPRCPSFMPGKCDKIVPTWTEVGHEHWANCLLYEEPGK